MVEASVENRLDCARRHGQVAGRSNDYMVVVVACSCPSVRRQLPYGSNFKA
jgi:predicted nucleic acid-binding Zn finger protein